jgi:hypothetical protein
LIIFFVNSEIKKFKYEKNVYEISDLRTLKKEVNLYCNEKITFNPDSPDTDIQILKINEYLNKKYALYFKIIRNNTYIDKSYIFDFKNNEPETEKILSNINKYNEINKVISEDGYGPVSKKYFENDDNFIIYNDFNINFYDMKIISKLLKKLKFKIKIIYIENFYNKIDSYRVPLLYSKPPYNNFQNLPKYIKYYENFENWERHQDISPKLNKQKYLRFYLNTFIDIINSRVSFLNPYFENIKDLSDLIFPNYDFKESYKKLINLINKSQSIELEKIIKILNQQNKYLNILIPENFNLINNNHINNISLIKTLINKPSKNNIYLLANILNSSFNFHKSLFEF